MIDCDDVNLQNKEMHQYNLWRKETINRIINITNQKRKEAEWHRLFPTIETTLTNEVY
jgi:hypothetical protein